MTLPEYIDLPGWTLLPYVDNRCVVCSNHKSNYGDFPYLKELVFRTVNEKRSWFTKKIVRPLHLRVYCPVCRATVLMRPSIVDRLQQTPRNRQQIEEELVLLRRQVEASSSAIELLKNQSKEFDEWIKKFKVELAELARKYEALSPVVQKKSSDRPEVPVDFPQGENNV